MKISTPLLNFLPYLKLNALCCLPSFSSPVFFYPFKVILSQSVIKFPVSSCKHLTSLASLEHQWRLPFPLLLIPRDGSIHNFAWASFWNKATLVFLREHPARWRFLYYLYQELQSLLDSQTEPKPWPYQALLGPTIFFHYFREKYMSCQFKKHATQQLNIITVR